MKINALGVIWGNRDRRCRMMTLTRLEKVASIERPGGLLGRQKLQANQVGVIGSGRIKL